MCFELMRLHHFPVGTKLPFTALGEYLIKLCSICHPANIVMSFGHVDGLTEHSWQESQYSLYEGRSLVAFRIH